MTQIIKFNEFFARSSDVLPENSELEQILGRLPNLSKDEIDSLAKIAVLKKERLSVIAIYL